jgi:hypothetical protein
MGDLIMDNEQEIYWIRADQTKNWHPFRSIMIEVGLHMLHPRHFEEKIYFFANPLDIAG